MKRADLAHAVRERLVRYQQPYDNHYGVVPAPPPETGVSVVPVMARYEAANAALGRVGALEAELQDPWVVSRVLARQEAVSSSAIEGTYSTLDELLSVEEAEGGMASEAAVQVRDYAVALDRLVPEARRRGHAIFTPDLVRSLHEAVMRGDRHYKDRPGALRKDVVWIGSRKDIAYSTYNPTPPEFVGACLAETLDYMRCEGLQAVQQGLLTRMAVAHAHFEAVHPFRDGNGRAGRLLLPLMMAAEGRVPLYLSPYIEANKDAYYDALKRAQQRLEWHAAVGFMADAVVGTVDELMATRAALARLAEAWRGRRRFRQGSGALRSLDVLPHYPVITITRLAGLLGVSFPAASTAVAQLVDAGILRERTGYSQNRIFAAPEALSVINRPFGAEPILPEGREEPPGSSMP